MTRLSLLLMIAALAWACSEKTSRLTGGAPVLKKGKALAHQYIIVDGHVDLPYRLNVINFRLEREYLGIPVKSSEGDFDHERAKEGGLDAPFMSIYIPSSYQEGGAKDFADELINMVVGIAKAHPDHFALANSPKEVEANFMKGLISLPMGMENGAPIEDDLNNINYFYNRGIRYITLTHSRDNQICDSSYDTTRTWNGLSPFGREVVREMNRVGVMIDISHVSDSSFYQTLSIAKAPVIASHSSCRKFTPGFERNMNDDMLKALAENGGVIMINFGSSFLDGEIQKQSDQHRAELGRILQEQGLDWDDKEADPVIRDYERKNPSLYSDVETVADHIEHVVMIAGIDHVGLGSDFDGVGDSLPTGLKDVSDYPNLLAVLLRRGFSDSDIAKICHQNIFRVWNRTIAVANETP